MIPEDRDTPLRSDINAEVLTLEDLLAEGTCEYLHPEIDTGEPVGEEMW